MSRSYKHTPRSGDKKSKYGKNFANRRIRRIKTIVPNHKSYRKYYESYNICDYEEVGLSFEEYCKYRRQYNSILNKPIFISSIKSEYEKDYLRK